MAETYAYLGDIQRGYFEYVDTETQRMLVADPGKSYGIRAIDPGYQIPPPDGRWVSVQETESEPAPTESPVDSAEEPASTEDHETGD